MTDDVRHAPPLIDKLRAHGKASDSIAWNGQARQLLLWAADAIEAANVALSETGPTRNAVLNQLTPMTFELGSYRACGFPQNLVVVPWEQVKLVLKNAAPQAATSRTAAPITGWHPEKPAEPASPAGASPNRNVAKRLRQAFADGDWGAVEDIADLLDERSER